MGSTRPDVLLLALNIAHLSGWDTAQGVGKVRVSEL